MPERAAATLIDISRFRGRFFAVLQETGRSQTAVMTIEPGRDAPPREEPRGRALFCLTVYAPPAY